MSDQPNPQPEAFDANLEKEVADALGDLSVMDLLNEGEPPTADRPQAHDMSGDPTLTRGTIVAIHDDDVFVDVGGKSQGIIPLSQFGEDKPTIGQRMDFVVEGLLGDEGLLKLSREGAVAKATWDTLERGMIIEARVTGSNTGGLELKVAGQRAFMPASHVAKEHVDNLNEFLNQKMTCEVLELDRRAKRLVLSRRAVIEKEQKEAAKKLLTTLEVGQVREGTIRSIQKYGAFVDIGGIDGLIHVSDMSYGHVDDPAKIVKVGETVQVKVLKVDLENDRISLGLKQAAPDPWSTVAEKYPPKTQISGRVTRLANFGAFVELEEGVEGLIPMGEMAWGRVGNASQVVQANQVVTAMVLDVDAKRRRISLSLKQMQNDPWTGVDGKYTPDQEVTGTVTRTAAFGAFVQIEDGVEGMIHISELADRRVGTVEDVVKEGQEVKAKVLAVDPDQRRISLSIRALTAGDRSGRDDRDGEGRAPHSKASRDDIRKYVVKDTKQAHAGESLGALLDKFGGPDGGLKGGLG